MGKKNRNVRNSNTNNGFKIPESVARFIKMDYKKFKKKNSGLYDSKKETKRAYYYELLDLFPEVVQLLVRYGYVKEVVEIKNSLYEKLIDPSFIKVLTHAIENEEEIDNIKLFPIVIRDVVESAKIQEAKDKEEDPNASEYDVSDLIELAQLILKKKLKKLKKKEVDPDVAFDCLCIIPDDKVLEDKQIIFKLRTLMAVLYEHAKTKTINFDVLIKSMFPGKYASQIITFCLLERKDKFANFDDKQKEFFIQINEWIFNIMEEMDKGSIESILNSYIEARKRDDGQNRDTNRRYFLKSLPESEYPRVYKVIKHLLEVNPDADKFF